MDTEAVSHKMVGNVGVLFYKFAEAVDRFDACRAEEFFIAIFFFKSIIMKQDDNSAKIPAEISFK